MYVQRFDFVWYFFFPFPLFLSLPLFIYRFISFLVQSVTHFHSLHSSNTGWRWQRRWQQLKKIAKVVVVVVVFSRFHCNNESNNNNIHTDIYKSQWTIKQATNGSDKYGLLLNHPHIKTNQSTSHRRWFKNKPSQDKSEKSRKKKIKTQTHGERESHTLIHH